MTRQTVSIGEVIFEPQASGRELVKLGSVQIGEIMPVADPRSRYKMAVRITLPQSPAGAWQPAHSTDHAHMKARHFISDWLEAIQR